jgi:hypothetical protein
MQNENHYLPLDATYHKNPYHLFGVFLRETQRKKTGKQHAKAIQDGMSKYFQVNPPRFDEAKCSRLTKDDYLIMSSIVDYKDHVDVLNWMVKDTLTDLPDDFSILKKHHSKYLASKLGYTYPTDDDLHADYKYGPYGGFGSSLTPRYKKVISRS